ncbi:DinB family protein [Emticicia sp. SJ17W-69]|uniref:DinB family protein n=1 Tax=Emticicia sp. SJ17W-69 TaxID=3421657 RepID=UPI003EB7E21F
MNQEINRIIKAIKAAYDGKGWFGDNLLQQLEGIDAVKAYKVPEKLNHSIAEIIHHMMAWRLFVVEKLNGNAEYEVWDTELNWVKITSLDEGNWVFLKQKLAENQQLLIQTIQQKAEELLDSKVDGRSYNFRLMLQGITQHDIYHIGQISMVKKLVS